jgi:hypothetical protein
MKSFCVAALAGFLLFTGCKKQQSDVPNMEDELSSDDTTNVELAMRSCNPGLSKQTLWELQQARAATARYRNIANATRDGYSDINVIKENMGYHFMRSEIVNAVFEVRKPEILVYNKHEDGQFELVAVEYAVPIDLTPDKAPAGFTGTRDVWERNTDFGLWLLHAWVWKHNPEGVFNPTNPSVHVH